MISEVKFATEHTSTWRLVAPAIDLLVRRINLDLYEREFKALESAVLGSRRGLVNEVAFDVFCLSPNDGFDSKWSDELHTEAFSKAQRKIAALENMSVKDIAALNDIELEDCSAQVFRLRHFFRRLAKGNTIESRPRFAGAGILDTCEGDLYFETSLFEVKAGQRPFKSVDLKQLLTYAALNHAGGVRTISQIGLFNPRMGTSFCAPIDFVSLEVCGCPAPELFREIIRIISSGDVSR